MSGGTAVILRHESADSGGENQIVSMLRKARLAFRFVPYSASIFGQGSRFRLEGDGRSPPRMTLDGRTV